MRLYKCIKCGTQEEPLKFMRTKTFLCTDCRRGRREVEEICNDTSIIDKNKIIDYLVNKGFTLSPTGTPYKQYGKHRVALSKTCGLPMLIVKYLDEMTPYTDSSIISNVPEEAVIDLKIIINTIEALWQK